MEKFDWTKPTSEALVYFHAQGIPIAEIIDEVYEDIRKSYKNINEFDADKTVILLIDKVKSKAETKKEKLDLDEIVSHGTLITPAFLIYCTEQIEKNEYRNFYDFLAKNKLEFRK